MRLSVVVPTHNRAESVRKTLEAMEHQSLPMDDFEVIVVDDGSDEATRGVLRGYRWPYSYRLVEKPNGGLASARNLGADHARGDILCFLDDDVVPSPDTLREHLLGHEGESAGRPAVVVGALPYPAGVRLDSFLWYLEESGHYDLYSKAAKKYPEGRPPLPPLNGNASIAREVFFRAGKYDESFSQYGGEDLEMGYRLAKAGVEFVYNPRAVGYHGHVKDFGRFCADMEKAGESLIRIYRKHPEIKAAKKIDVVEDPIGSLPGGKKIVKAILSLTMACPWLLVLPCLLIRIGGRHFALRRVLFPFYRWISHYHYALGMRKGLAVQA